MFRRPNGASSSCQSYPRQLHKAMSEFFPHSGLPLLSDDGRVRWTARLLVMAALFMVWSPGRTLKDRLAEARDSLARIYPTRRRPGRSHEGFSKALARHGSGILAALSDHWRRCARRVADGCWNHDRWVLFGVDGSLFNCPRTGANEKAFGAGGRSNGGPQQRVTCLFHVVSGLIGCWERGPVRKNSERRQFRQMLHLLPPNAMVLADAGFHGYDLLRLLLNQGGSFLIRVGGNVTLLKKLGYAVKEHRQTVYLWPQQQQGRVGCRKDTGSDPRRRTQCKRIEAPLVLRLIRLTDSKGKPVCLLTNVLEKSRLGDFAAERMYRLRWGIEVMWRGLKQTLGHHKMLSGAPDRAAAELDWAMAGLWMLQLISVKRMAESGQLPRRYSPAESLRVLRQAMSDRRQSRRSLKDELTDAVMDEYHRHGPKQARNNLHKRPQRPPGEPVARMATEAEKRLAQRILNHPPPNSLAA
jgi:hypothetical protein